MEEKNKYYCPDCGTEMRQLYQKPALNLTCPNCGCKVATTKWEDIDLDETIYELGIPKQNNITIDAIKIVSKMTGKNFIETKCNLENGSIIIKGNAKEISNIKNILFNAGIEFEITPNFKYQ